MVGGKNGYGIKLANIFSKKLTIETVDRKTAKKYTQTWTDNMTTVGVPKITSCKSKPYVSVSWVPDFEKFGLHGITPDMLSIFRRRATDLAMTVGKEVKVFWKIGEEKTLIKCRDLAVYAGEYLEGPVVHYSCDRWDIAVADSPTGSFLQVSFVNGIWTSRYLDTKKKIKVKPSTVKENLAIFISCQIENPSFNSQTKEMLTTKSGAFGSVCKIPEETLKKIQSKLEITDKLILVQREKDEKDNKKSDGKKQSKIYGIPKLD
ncbi:MAG: hypothetical protein EBT86_03680, partial [Actinobacteria bacterium]|nr:hypothetical protein [Actinomycetota bacterium]